MTANRRESFAVSEILSDIEAFGEELQGDAAGVAMILDALSLSLGDRHDVTGPEYEKYEDSERGRMIAESEHSSSQAWNWLKDELEALAKKCRSSAEFYI